jgi:hypothetical protein
MPLGGGGAGNQIVDAGGTGSDNTSIWFVTWSEKATHLIHPKGTKAGIDRQDKGEQRVTDANGNAYYVKEELFRWHLGVAVRDWRYNAASPTSTCRHDRRHRRPLQVHAQGVLQAAGRLRDGDARRDGSINGNASVEGRTVIYMNRTILEALDATGTNASNGALMLKPMELEGRTVQSYRGIPIEVTDALLNTETRVV